MYRRRGRLCALVGLGLAAIARAGEGIDPVENYCRRLDHQSAVVDGSLWIDGGRMSFADFNSTDRSVIGNITLGINEYLIEVDMSASWNWKTNISITAHNKTGDASGDVEPNLSRGALFRGGAGTRAFFSYGGTVSYANTSFPGWQAPGSSGDDADALWRYDAGNGTWARHAATGSTRPANGAAADAPGLGLGFVLGGELDRGSSAATARLGAALEQFLKGMVVLDFGALSARNLSTAAISTLGRSRARMVYLPAVGDKGVLVLIGGGAKSTLDESKNWAGSLVSMSTVHVFDVASYYNASSSDGDWYHQTTSGTETPDPRIDHCLVVVSAPDGSSHNIYLYGGRDDSGTYFDDVWVLSLPSFKWIKIYEGSSPRYGMTCHVVGNRQMLTVGGSISSNLTANCDWEYRGVAIYDLSTLSWGPIYDAAAAEYQLPAEIYQVVGGDTNGGATITEPANGWDQAALGSIFSSTNSTSSTTSPSSGTHKSAIIGGVVGGVAGVALLATGALLFLRRHGRTQHDGAHDGGEYAPAPDAAAAAAAAGKPGNEYAELHNRSAYAEVPATSMDPVEKDAGDEIVEKDEDVDRSHSYDPVELPGSSSSSSSSAHEPAREPARELDSIHSVLRQ